MTKLGGLVGAALLSALLLALGEGIPVSNDFAVIPIIVVVGGIGAFLGSQLVRLLRNRHRGRSASTGTLR